MEDESDDSFSHSVRLSALELLLVGECLHDIPHEFLWLSSRLQVNSKKKQGLVYGKLFSKSIHIELNHFNQCISSSRHLSHAEALKNNNSSRWYVDIH